MIEIDVKIGSVTLTFAIHWVLLVLIGLLVWWLA